MIELVNINAGVEHGIFPIITVSSIDTGAPELLPRLTRRNPAICGSDGVAGTHSFR